MLTTIENPQLFYKVKQTPTDIMTNCPFHGADRNPSFGISRDEGLAHCFACGYKNSFSGFVDDLNMGHIFDTNLPIAEENTIEIDLGDCGVEPAINLENPYKNNVTHYWRKRGITKEIKDLFELGYDETTKDVTFPIKDLCGNITGFIRRSTKEKKFHIDKSLKKTLFGMYELLLTNYKRHDIIIVESNIDALYLWSLGFPSLALNGTGSKSQYELIKQLPYRVIYLLLDNDKAGRMGTQKLSQALNKEFFVDVVQLPNTCKDANDMSKEQVIEALEKVGYFG